jgi:hypothetical protein
MYVFPVLLLLNAVSYLIISIRALVLHQPTIINSRIWLVLMIISFVPALIISLKINFLVVYSFFVIKGHNVYGITDTDFRNAIINSLDKNKVNYTEKMNSLELTDLNNQINISFASWIGSGTIRLKNKKDTVLFETIISDMKMYCKNNKIIISKKIPIFLIFFSIFFIALAIVFLMILL